MCLLTPLLSSCRAHCGHALEVSTFIEFIYITLAAKGYISIATLKPDSDIIMNPFKSSDKKEK